MNLVDSRAKAAQARCWRLRARIPSAPCVKFHGSPCLAHHDVREKDIDLKRLGAVLAVAYEKQLRDFANLLLLENLGPRTLQSLALIAEVVHGTPTRFADPARFSFAHGGKDGHPFPVPLKTYDESLSVLRRALAAGQSRPTEKIERLRRLDRFTRMVENQSQPKPISKQLWRMSARFRRRSTEGQSSMIEAASKTGKKDDKQLRLF